jgi:hypothetical protein
VGVALPDIVWRALDENGKADPVGLSSSLATISSICSATPAGSVFLARFPVLPFYPDAVGAILGNGTEYWPTLDAIMQAFTSSGCFTLVPIIFYNPYALVDAFREPMGLFASAARNKTMVGGKLAGGVSNAWDASLAYLRALIPRYSTWTSIRAWELSNDWNLQFDMDAGSGCYACEPLRGTPAARSRWDNISTYDGVKVQQAWAGYIRALDGALSRPISSGHAMPRPAAFHLSQSYFSGSMDFSLDSFAQFTAVLAATHEGLDWVSVHLAPGGGMVRWTGEWALSDPSGGALQTLVALTVALDNSTQVSRGGLSQQRLFVGEFLGSPPQSPPNTSTLAFLDASGSAVRSGSPFIDELLYGLQATGLNSPSPPLTAITGLFRAAALGAVNWTTASNRSSAAGIYGWERYASKWPGQVDGVYAALSSLLLNGTQSSVVEALRTYNTLHSVPSYVIPGQCDVSLFLPAYNFHHTERMQLARQCFSSIQQLAMGEFAPPSQLDVATVMCKGACREYGNIWLRLQEAWGMANCHCSPPGWAQYGGPSAPLDAALADLTNQGFLCPHSPNVELCRRTGLCYQEAPFYNATCSATACGRFSKSSVEYAAKRKACNLPADGAGAGAALAGSALALAAGLALASSWPH